MNLRTAQVRALSRGHLLVLLLWDAVPGLMGRTATEGEMCTPRRGFILCQRPTAIAFLPLAALLFASGACFPLFHSEPTGAKPERTKQNLMK